MDTKQLHTFHHLAGTLNFSKTAVALNYAQSTISAQIQTLEKDLETKLFNRLGRQVTLTEAGQRLLKYAEKIITLDTEARLDLSDEDEVKGKITIAAAGTLCIYHLPPILGRFREQYPLVQINILPQHTMVETSRQLRTGVVDIAFVLSRPVKTAETITRHLTDDPITLVAHPNHPLVHAPIPTLADLQKYPLILTEPTCSYRRLLEKHMRQQGYPIEPTISFENVEAVKQCAMANVGLGFLPRVVVADALAQETLVEIPVFAKPWGVVTQMVWHKDKWFSSAHKALFEIVASHHALAA